MYLWFSSKPAYMKKREKLELISAISKHIAIVFLSIVAKVMDNGIIANKKGFY